MFSKKSENILVIKADSLPAFVAAEPVFEAIRGAHPDAQISLLTSGPLQRVARAAPYFDQVAAVPDLKIAEARIAFVKQLKAAKFSRVYDLAADGVSRRLQSALGPFGPKWHSAEPAPGRLGRNEAPRPLLPDPSRALAADGIEMRSRRPDFSWALEARKDAANMKPGWFGISGAFGLLMPGPDESRRWPAAHYAAFAKIMATSGVMPILTGSKDLHGFADKVAHDAPETVDLTGKTDHLQLSALARGALFYVTDAADEVELAAAVGAAGVVIRHPGEAGLAPEGRQLLVLTHNEGLERVEPAYVWRALGNLGLLPEEDRLARASAR